MPRPGDRPLRDKLVWFVVLWAGGVICVAAVAFAIKLALGL